MPASPRDWAIGPDGAAASITQTPAAPATDTGRRRAGDDDDAERDIISLVVSARPIGSNSLARER